MVEIFTAVYFFLSFREHCCLERSQIAAAFSQSSFKRGLKWSRFIHSVFVTALARHKEKKGSSWIKPHQSVEIVAGRWWRMRLQLNQLPWFDPSLISWFESAWIVAQRWLSKSEVHTASKSRYNLNAICLFGKAITAQTHNSTLRRVDMSETCRPALASF